MPTIVQFRRGTTAQNDNFTGAAGEISVDTTLDTLRVHDGATQGGSELATTTAVQTLTNKSFGSNLLPDTDSAYDLGGVGLKWKDLYLSGNTIFLGDAQISASGSSVILPAGTQIGDTSIRGLLSGATGVTYNSSTGAISIGQDVDSSADVVFGTLETSGNVTVGGNLIVNGTTTTINSTTLDVDDLNITVASGAADSAAADGAGLTVDGANATFTYNAVGDTWNFNKAFGTDTNVLANYTTDELGEGSTNLYYTSVRSDSDFNANLATKTTDNLTEGSNLYYTTGRFDTRLATKTTDDLTEGESNLYFTDAKARAAFSAAGDLSYNSGTGEFSIDVESIYTKANFDSDLGLAFSTSAVTTDDLIEASNLYYTDARARSAISAGGGLAYDSASGIMSFTERTDGEVRGLFSAGGDLAYDSATGRFTINSSTNDEVRGLFSATDAGGDGSFAYDSATGTFTYTGPSASEVRAHFSGGTGITITDGSIATTDSDIVHDNLSGFVADEHIDHSGVSITAGSGLTGGGDITATRTLNIGAGTGVTVNADDIAIGQDVATTADVTFNNITNNGYLDLKHDSDADLVPYSEGRMFYHNEYKTLTVLSDVSDVSLQVGLENWIRVYNNTGSTIANGTPVYITGAVGETPTVAPADASTANKAYTIGVATHDITDTSEGFITHFGLVSGIDTSNLTAGQNIHIAPDGTLQTDAPTYPYFPTDIGSCVVSDSSNGYILVNIEHHTFEQFRVTGNQHVDGDMTIEGDLTVTGTQSIVSQANLAVDTSFIYTNSGDTIGADNTTFTGSGLDDGILTGHYKGTETAKGFYVEIDGTGTPDTFKWSHDSDFSTTEASGVAITGDDQVLANGININFNATTGHTSGDTWSGTASPVNVDAGFASNRNTGATGVGYTHMGAFFDVSDEKWKFFKSYLPEPEGTIDTTDSSYEKATVDANLTGNVTGNLTGDVTGNAATATALETARTIGGVSFDGSSNINLPGVNATGNQDTTGSAATLTTPRTIGGVSFDGSANINLPGVNTTGNQDTTGSAATLTTGRTISLTGDVTGTSASFDGSGNVSIAATIAANSVALGTDTLGAYVATIATGTGLDGSSSGEGGTPTITLDLSELTDMTAGVDGASDELILLDAGAERKKRIGEINLGQFNNDQGWTSNVGDITGVTAGSGISGGGTSGTVTINHADTSSQSSVNNSGRTYIQDITLDTYGHITGITSATETVTNTTYSAGTALDLSGTTFNVDLSELSTSTTNGDGDYFVVVDTSNVQRKLTKGNIAISGFNNDAGYTTNVGDITGVTAGTGLTGGGASGGVTLNVDVGTSANKIVQLNGSAQLPAVDGSLLTGISAGATVTDKTDNTNYNIVFTNETSGTQSLAGIDNGALTYNPSTGILNSTDFNATSDESLKTNIETIQDAASKVAQLRGVNFNWKANDRKAMGVIAQEVEKIIPEVVNEENGTKSVSYGAMVGLLIEAVKDLQNQVNELKK